MLVRMTVELRLGGEPADIAQVLALLEGELDVAGNGRTYQKRGGFGVHVYVEARPRPVTTATAERADRPGLPPTGIGR